MKATGMIRHIDELGRIVIPKEMRRKMDIQNNDPVEIFVEGDHILLSKYVPCCIFCAGTDVDETFGLAHTVEKSAEIFVKIASMTGGKSVLQTITNDNMRESVLPAVRRLPRMKSDLFSAPLGAVRPSFL